ncbi:c-type cytochrome biogenesis protein CcsB [soil metagenome]
MKASDDMTLEQYASFSNSAVASATVVLALAWLAYLAEWAFGRQFHALSAIPVGSNAGHVTPDPPEASRSEVAGRIGLSLTVLGWLVLLAGVATRALAAQRVPWGNMYEFAITGGVIVVGGYLLLVKTSQIQWLGPLITGFTVVVLGSSILVYVPAGPLVPALDSYWLYIHVAAAMIGGSGFLVGASASALYLVKARAENRTSEPDRVGYIWRLPTSEAMDQLAYRANAFAFPIWTFAALIAGPIWAQYAWGRYWGWDPKEVWAFITWVIYAGYLHARATAGWRGKAAAFIALVGFASFLFNFVGVNLFIAGLHSYAK